MPRECYHTVLRHWLVMTDGRLSLVYQLWSVQLSTQKARRLWGCLAGPVSFSFAVPKFSWCSDPKSKVLDLTLGHKTSVQWSLKKKKKRQQKNTNKNYPYRAVKLLCIPLTKDENLFKLNTTLMKTRHLHSQTNAFSLTAIVCHWPFVFGQITLLLWVMDNTKAPEPVTNSSAHFKFVF